LERIYEALKKISSPSWGEAYFFQMKNPRGLHPQWVYFFKERFYQDKMMEEVSM
jgi:hypothetical protein